VFNQYEREYKKTFEKIIKKEFSGELEQSMLHLGKNVIYNFLVRSIQNRANFLAQQFESSMVGIGTRTDILCRISLRCASLQMREAVKKEYMFLYNNSLEKRIRGEQLQLNFTEFLVKYFAF
jgi:annexin A7/11